jgi:hypothetical protein
MFWQWFRGRRQQCSQPTRQAYRRRAARCLPRVESLEERLAPAIAIWTGADAMHNTNWSNPLNWYLSAPPGANDTAEFTSNSNVQAYSSTVDTGFTVADVLIDSTWGGIITVNNSLTITDNLTLASGSFGGSGAMSVAGSSSTWSGGELDVGAGGFTNNGALTISAPASTDSWALSGAGTLFNKGTIIQTGDGQVSMRNGVTLSTLANATYNFQGDGSIGQVNGTDTFNNSGLLEKTSGTGTVIIGSSITNSGSITVQTGTLALYSAGGTNTGGVFTISAGATLDLTYNTTVTYGGTYTGSGAGAVALKYGTLAVAGSYTEASTATLTIKIGGRASSPTIGSIVSTTGSVSLAGKLTVTATSTPSGGTAFTILDNEGGSAISGMFAGLPEGATFTVNGMTFQISYVGGDGHDVVITRTA